MNRSPSLAPAPDWLRGWLVVCLTLGVLALPGCGGCRQETAAERAAREAREEEEAIKRRQEEEARRKTPPLEATTPDPQPNNADGKLRLVKPGHWMAATQAMKANDDNWVGEATLQVVDRDNQPIPVDRTAFAVRSGRDVALAKGEPKQVESTFYVPFYKDPSPSLAMNTANQKEPGLAARITLRERGAGLAAPPTNRDFERMKPHQHHLVVLADEPLRYNYLSTLKCVVAPYSDDFSWTLGNGDYSHKRQYYIVKPPPEVTPPLPENPLCWTTIAFVLWDEIDPERLNAAQRDAMIDWLHWGGQLIVSGPGTLDLLKESFLDAYLPAESGGAWAITTDDLEPLREAWRPATTGAKRLEPRLDLPGVELKLRPEGKRVPEVGKLFAERRVGRGRVLVSALPLDSSDLVGWRAGIENLVNGLLLRRPAREFMGPKTTFAEGSDDKEVHVVRPIRDKFVRFDRNSTVRYFARDTFENPAAHAYEIVRPSGDLASNDDSLTLKDPPARGGVAAWSDSGATAIAARDVLRKAAGVSVPGTGFVVTCLAVYLTVLAPLNWFVFKALGRVELAWLAAPVIALAGTWVVVRQAQLDIGFVRAQTEVAILETQPDHPRGCLTRYLSFYTSLSTTYDLEFDNPTTLAAPFARTDASPLRKGEAPDLVTYERQDKSWLRGLPVASNTTDLAHTEQMIDLGGALRFDDRANKLVNETDYEFTSLAVVRRPPGANSPSTLEGCWIGTLGGRSSTTVSFSRGVAGPDEAAFTSERAADAAGKERLDFEDLFRLALDTKHLEPGEVRAVAYLDRFLPGVTVTPAASQLRGGTLLVAHLKYGRLPKLEKDRQSPTDVLPRR